MIRSHRIPAFALIMAVAAASLVATTPATAAVRAVDYFAPAAHGDSVVFAGRTPTQGIELWVTDATPEGTRVLKDVYPGAKSAFSANLTSHNAPQFTAVGSTTFFVASDATGSNLWKTDGTTAGTVRVTSRTKFAPTGLTVFNGALYFAARTSDRGVELWTSDGTNTGTTRVTDLKPGTSSSNPSGLTVVDDSLFFVATTSSHARVLHVIDSTGAVTAGPVLSNTATLKAAAGRAGKLVYLDASKVWESDGTVAGTHVLIESLSIDAGSTFTSFGGEVYLVKASNTSGKLARVTGSGTELVSPLLVERAYVFDETLWFVGYDQASLSWSLWSLSSSSAEPVKLGDIHQGRKTEGYKWKFAPTYSNGTLYAEVYGILWASDGTAAGTRAVRNLGMTLGQHEYLELAASGDVVAITYFAGSLKSRLWLSDGTEAGTYRQFPAQKFAKAPAPKIEGSAVEGFTVTANPGKWNLAAASYSYQWRINGSPIEGATTSTLVVPEVAPGSTLTVSVTGSRRAFVTRTVTSAPTTVTKQFVDAPTPTLSGTLAAGEVLTADAGTWSPSATLSYAWFADGKAIYKGPKTNKYTVTATSQFKSITVTVTAKKSGYLTTSRTSLPR